MNDAHNLYEKPNTQKEGLKNLQSIEPFILEIRNQKVILDSDIAKIYGVESKRVNEAVKRNIDKFPKECILELNQEEWKLLKPHFATSKGGKVNPPKSFTEKSIYVGTYPEVKASHSSNNSNYRNLIAMLDNNQMYDEKCEISEGDKKQQRNFIRSKLKYGEQSIAFFNIL